MKRLRYTTPQGPEAEYEPGSRGRVLRNLRGIRSKREMDRAEIEALERAQVAYLDRIGPATPITAELICRMHRDWLGDLYEWAGWYRTVDMAKAGFSWPPAFRVEQNMQVIEKEVLLRKTPCRPGSVDRVVTDMAEVHAELLLVHPFREGNGRLARWVADIMALQAGYPLPAYGFAGRGSTAESRRYLGAVKRGYVKDYCPLADFFADAIKRGGTAT
jgi:cell filamentation protein